MYTSRSFLFGMFFSNNSSTNLAFKTPLNCDLDSKKISHSRNKKNESVSPVTLCMAPSWLSFHGKPVSENAVLGCLSGTGSQLFFQCFVPADLEMILESWTESGQEDMFHLAG